MNKEMCVARRVSWNNLPEEKERAEPSHDMRARITWRGSLSIDLPQSEERAG